MAYWLLEAADQRDGTDKAAVQPESKHGYYWLFRAYYKEPYG